MPIDLRNIGSIAPNGNGTISVPGSVDITGTPAPQFLINGVPLATGGVTSISPGSLTGAVTLQAGANVSITPSGQNIIIASTGGGTGSSQWIDIAGGGIYYGGGNVGIATANPATRLDCNGTVRSTDYVPPPSSGAGMEMFFVPTENRGNVISYDRGAGAYRGLQIEGAPLSLNGASGGAVGIGTTTPTSKLHVYGGRSMFMNPSEPYCIGLQALSAGLNIYLGTDASGVFRLDDSGGNPRVQVTQNGTMFLNAASPFDIGNPRLQVWGGLTVTGLADNLIANLRLVGPGQVYGFIFRNDDTNFSLLATAPFDAYGTWSNPIPVQIDLATKTIGLRAAPNASYGVNVDSLNATALYINGAEVTAGGGGGQMLQRTGFRIRQSQVFYRPFFTGTDGQTFTVYVAKYGQSFGALALQVINVGRGWYQITYTVNETNLLGPLMTYLEYAGGSITFADEVVT